MKLSIITIGKDNLTDLVRTINSIDNQSLKPYEHIIVYADTKNEILRIKEAKKEKYRHFYINEDCGLYNAMNLGQNKSTGTNIYFLNAGDTLIDINAIEIIHKMDKPNTIQIYPVIQHFNNNFFLRYKDKKRLKKFSPHQGFVAPISEQLIHFNEINEISADAQWMRKYKSIYPSNVFETPICQFELSGISNIPTFNSIKKRLEQRRFKKLILEIIKWIIFKTTDLTNYYKIILRLNGQTKINNEL